MTIMQDGGSSGMELTSAPNKKEKSDGSTAGYYDLPHGAKSIEDLISYRNMNYNLGIMFKMVSDYDTYDGCDEYPVDATMLQDLISYYDLNAQFGEIFRALFRFGHVAHSEEIRDAKKIKFYLNAERDRLLKYEPHDDGKMTDVLRMLDLIDHEIRRLSE